MLPELVTSRAYLAAGPGNIDTSLRQKHEQWFETKLRTEPWLRWTVISAPRRLTNAGCHRISCFLRHVGDVFATKPKCGRASSGQCAYQSGRALPGYDGTWRMWGKQFSRGPIEVAVGKRMTGTLWATPASNSGGHSNPKEL